MPLSSDAMDYRNREQAGSTLIEALIAVVILSILCLAGGRAIVQFTAITLTTSHIGIRDLDLLRIGSHVSSGPLVLKSYAAGNWDSGSGEVINPCLRSCIDGTANAGICDDGGANVNPSCQSLNGGNQPIWYALTAYDPLQSIPIAGPDPGDNAGAKNANPNLRVDMRYDLEGSLCATALPDSVCPLHAKLFFNPICRSSTGTMTASCPQATSYVIRLTMAWSTTAMPLEPAALRTYDFQWELQCLDILTTGYSPQLNCPILSGFSGS